MAKVKIFSGMLIVVALLFGLVSSVQAQPELPSSFYGLIQFSDSAPTVGTTVEAFVPGISGPVSTTITKMDGSNHVYNINVLGDILDTPEKEGGAENDEVTFKIDGRIVATGIWHSGTNVSLNFHPPAANAGGPYTGVVNESISFFGSVIDAGSDVDTFEWDWDNDGTSDEAGQNPTHSWPTVGSYTIGLKVTDLQKGEGATTVQVTIGKAPVTVTVDSGQSKIFGEVDPIAFTYTSSVAGVPFTGSLSRDTGEDAGMYAINQGTLEAGANYTITFVGDNFTITPKPVTITPTPGLTKVFGGSDPEFTYTSSEAVSFTGALGRANGEGAGTYAITLGDLSAGTNYSLNLVATDFTITAKPITVTADAGLIKVFGEADPVFTYTSSDAGAAFTGALSREVGEVVGSYAITLGTLSAGSNYSLTFVSSTFNITAKPITVTADAGLTKIFGEADPVFTYTSSDAGAAFTGALSREVGEVVGPYAITLGTLSAGSNYSLTFVSSTFNITAKPITVTADAGLTKIFGEADPVFTYTSSDAGAAFTGALSREVGEVVGPYAITLGTLSAGSNYSLTFVSSTFNITAKPITVTADAGLIKVFGEADPIFTYTSSDAEATFTGALSRVTGEDVGPYAITIGTLSAGSNYSITFVPATFNVTAKPITVTADAKSKVYGQADPTLTFTYTPNDPPITFTGALSREPGDTVDTYGILQNDLTAGTNYSITYVSANFTITPAAATISLSGLSHIYDGTPKSVTITTNPAGLTYSVTYNGSPVAPSAAGNYTIVATITDPNYTGSASGTMVISAFHSIDLVAGWNLVSFSLHPTSTVVADVLSSVSGNYDLVYAWNAAVASNNWQRADNNPISPDTLTVLDETRGFWIHMTNADTLEVVGSVPPSSTISLYDNAGGWNLVGYPSGSNGALPAVISANTSMVYAYHAAETSDVWKLFDRNGPGFANDLTSMAPGWGYWVKVSADENWTIGY